MKADGGDNEIPTAKANEKKANLAKDEKIKKLWENLVNDWLGFGSKKSKDNDSAKD